MNQIKKIGYYLLAIAGLLGFVYIRGCMAGRKPNPGPAALKPTDKEQVLIDPTHHTITVVTHTGTTRTTLPDRPSIITEDVSGRLTISTPQFGYQQRPFIGAGNDGRWRLVGGCDLFYFKKLDLGAGVSFEPYQVVETMRVMALLSYTIWSNTRLGVSLDNTGHFGGFITVRL